MIRIMRCLKNFSLDKISAQRRSKCFYNVLTNNETPSTYQQDTIKYDFNLALHPGQSYQGVANVKFKILNTKELFMDFSGKNIKQIIVNSQQVKPGDVYSSEKGRIDIPANLLKPGENNVCIKYQNVYDKDGSGCVSFIDVDKKQYLYTQFEPYMANRVFPIFDQPDLKAKMNLSIACPSEWQAVLSNQFQSSSPNFSTSSTVCQITRKILQQFQNALPSNYKITNFNDTKLLPSYLFCFVVGPYKKYNCINTYKNIPMNLYCIESLYPHMERLLPFIQQMTNKSMEFFEQYFGYPYPFSKYDQVFAHQYKWGAMENAGIVTLNDLYIFKDPVSTQKMINFGNTIVHEMAHHWFGNLVTMKWWDDLWLNQSFAQYISHFCLQKIKSSVKTINYQSAMASFLNRKSWGYNEDQLVTTHPIRSNVANTQVAESIFDGITYSKGAATMKQLMYLMGEDGFSKSLKQYFWNYQFKNAELADLLQYMKKNYKAKPGGVKIDKWRQMWLEKAGLNILQGQLDEKSSSFIIHQKAYHQNHNTLRSHVLKIALLKDPKNIISKQIMVQPEEITVIKLTQGQLRDFRQSKAILLNHEDLSFCKVIIDSKSVQYLKQHLDQIDDILFRSMIWKNFFDMVKDAHLKSAQYIQILQKNLFKQTSDSILQQNLNNAYTAIQKYTPKSQRSSLQQKLFKKCLEQLNKVDTSNKSVIIRDKIIFFANAESLQNIQILRNIYEEKQQQKVPKFVSPNITERWKLIIKILSSKLITKIDKKQLLDDMVERDQSDTMKNKKITCQAMLLDKKQMQTYFSELIEDATKNLGMTAFIHSLAGLNNRIHIQSLNSTIKNKYFEAIKASLQSKNHNLNVLKKNEMIELFIEHMDPNIEDNAEDLQWKIKQFSGIKVNNNDKIRIQIQKKIDSLKKRLKSYQLYK